MKTKGNTKEIYYYNQKKIISSNKDALIFWLDDDAKWLKEILLKNNYYDKYIKIMAVEIESYQDFMYKNGFNCCEMRHTLLDAGFKEEEIEKDN